MLENICRMKITEQIDDTLFVHTELTSEMTHMIDLYGIDYINDIYQQGLRNLLLSQDGDLPLDFQDIVNTFLYVENRDNYLKPNEASRLRNQGINRVIH